VKKSPSLDEIKAQSLMNVAKRRKSRFAGPTPAPALAAVVALSTSATVAPARPTSNSANGSKIYF
jgi:hypothetical protein